jgi:hypothetical protein
VITPIFERALLEGCARFCTHIHAYGAVSKIIVPENLVCFITGFTVSPYNDFKIDDNNTLPISDGYSTHTIDFFSRGNKRISWMYRNNFEFVKDYNEITYKKNSEPIHFDCFQRHEQNVYISLTNAFGLFNMLANDFGVLRESQNEPVPRGYSTRELTPNAPTVLFIRQKDESQYFPCGNVEAGTTLGSTDETEPNTKIGTTYFGLPNPFDGNGFNLYTPIVNIEYILISNSNLEKILNK